MSAAAIIARAQAASVSLWAEGEKLRWRAPVPPPPDLGEVLSLLRAHKGVVLRALREAAVTAVTDVTFPAYEREPDAAWWRDYFEERAAIRENDGGMSRVDAEAGALADCVSRWRARSPRTAANRFESAELTRAFDARQETLAFRKTIKLER